MRIAEGHVVAFGDLLEGICLDVIEGKPPFAKQPVAIAGELKRLHGLDLCVAASHRMMEPASTKPPRKREKPK
jgi:hypothetical protein